MSQSRFLPILLTAVLTAQSVIGGWGHSHAHVADGSHTHLVAAEHAHHHHAAGNHHHIHIHDSQESLPLHDQPAERDNCSICRHLALAAILTLDLEALANGDAAERVEQVESSIAATIAIGLRRPRSPPELS